MNIDVTPAGKTKPEITAWLLDWIAQELQMPKGEIDPARSLLDYSMSSVTATILVGDVEDWLGLHLSPTLVWDFPTIDAITDHLIQMQAEQKGSVPAETAAEPGEDAEALLARLDELSEEEVDALLKKLA